MKKILFVFATHWDAKQLECCRAAWEGLYEVEFAAPTDDTCTWDLDVLAYIDRVARAHEGRIQGVTSSSDYPGATVAAAIATRLGLPGPPPKTVIRASHKYYSRLAQREAAPEATPDFALVDPRDPPAAAGAIGFPCFVKPVKGAFSVMSRRIDTPVELAAFLARPAVEEFTRNYVRMFDQLVSGLTDMEIGGGWFLAEGLLRGRQATVEGYVLDDGQVEIFGLVDTVVHPSTGSFARFEYPSTLEAGVAERMADIARRAIRGLGLVHSLFNVEMIHDPRGDAIHIIEVNPRISGQFGDLYQKVDGTNSYEIALAVAAGERPRPRRRQGPFAAAASVPLRVFRAVRVARAPGEDDLRAAEALHPGTLIWPQCQTGQTLADFDYLQDGRSYRYAVINIGAPDHGALLSRCDEVRERLGFEFVRIDPREP